MPATAGVFLGITQSQSVDCAPSVQVGLYRTRVCPSHVDGHSPSTCASPIFAICCPLLTAKPSLDACHRAHPPHHILLSLLRTTIARHRSPPNSNATAGTTPPPPRACDRVSGPLYLSMYGSHGMISSDDQCTCKSRLEPPLCVRVEPVSLLTLLHNIHDGLRTQLFDSRVMVALGLSQDARERSPASQEVPPLLSRLGTAHGWSDVGFQISKSRAPIRIQIGPRLTVSFWSNHVDVVSWNAVEPEMRPAQPDVPSSPAQRSFSLSRCPGRGGGGRARLAPACG